MTLTPAPDLGAWLADPERLAPPWAADTLALQHGRKGSPFVAALYLGAYAAPWLAPRVARGSGGVWLLDGSATGGPSAVARHAAEALHAAASTVRASWREIHAARVEAVAYAVEVARWAVDDARALGATPAEVRALTVEALRLADDEAAVRAGREDLDALVLATTADALVGLATYRAAFLAALRDALPAVGLADGTTVDPAAVVQAVADSVEPGTFVPRSVVREALSAAAVPLAVVDVEALAAAAGLVRPNPSGKRSGIVGYVRRAS